MHAPPESAAGQKPFTSASPLCTVRRWFHKLAGLGDSPQRTAAAFALGVFLGFSPFLGLQIALGMTAAFVFRLHRVAVFLGLCVNLPIVMVPYYAVTTAAAAALLGGGNVGDLDARFSAVLAVPFYHVAFWERAGDLLGPFVWAFVAGSTGGAAILGSCAYVATLPMIARLKK